MAKSVAEYLEELEPWVTDWALTTQAEREIRRRGSSSAELQSFYDALVRRMEGIMGTLNELPLNDLPSDARVLMNLTLSLAEVAPHVEFYGGAPGVPHSFAEERFIALRGDRTTL